MELGRGIRLRLAGHVAGGLISLAALPLLVRHLGVPEFGRYVAVLSVVGIAALASDLGVTGLALREAAAADSGGRRGLLAGLLGVRMRLAVAGGAAAIVFAVVAGYATSVVAATAVAAVGLFPQVYLETAVASLTVDSRFAAAAVVELARSVAGTVTVVVLVIAGASLSWFIAAWALAALIGACVARAAVGAAVPVRPARPDPHVRNLLREAREYSLATVLHVLYFRAAMVVTSLSGGALQAGYFGVAFRLSEFLAAGAAQTASSATPTLARAGGAFGGELRRVLRMAALLGGGVAAALALAAPLVVKVLGGDQLDAAAPVVRIQAVAIGLMFVVFNLGAAVFVLRRHRQLALMNTLGLVAVTAVALLLVPEHGARGAAVAAVVGEAAMLAGLGAVVVRAGHRRADL